MSGSSSPFRQRLTDVMYFVTQLNGLVPAPGTFGFYLPPGKHNQSKVILKEPGQRFFNMKEKKKRTTIISNNQFNESGYLTTGAPSGTPGGIKHTCLKYLG